MVRVALAVLLACACSGHGPRGAPKSQVVAAASFPAIRFIPAHPTYAVAAHSIRDLQAATRDLFGSFGVLFDTDVSQLSKFLQSVIVVDPLAPDALSAIGVDADGGVAVFSESINPTLVVHLSSADQLASFFQQQRDHGMISESVIVGGREIFSAKLLGGAKVSWATDADWLWVHFTLPFDRDEPDAEWFTNSHDAGAPAWTADWKQAVTERSRLAGFADLKAILGKLPKSAGAGECAKLVEPIGHFGLAVENTDGANARLSVDIRHDLAAVLLPPPDGWDAAARGAPLAAQWNLDLAAVIRWAAPCMTALRLPPSSQSYGVRAGRVMLTSFDPDNKSGTGAAALDLANATTIRSYLDDVPLRSTLESDETFGPYRGKSLSVPFGPTIDYVLTDTLAIAAVGENVLAKVIGRGVGPPTHTLFSVDVVPSGLTSAAWQYLFAAAHVPGGTRAVDRLARWRELHLALTVDHTRLTLEARGARK